MPRSRIEPCECGQELTVQGYSLTTGNTLSCGCLRQETIERVNVKDLTGQRFGRLTVLARAPHVPPGRVRWFCRCACGQAAIVRSKELLKGHTHSCGCLRREVREATFVKHGAARKGQELPEYKVWMGIKARCTIPSADGYPRYGGRGITVCPQWHDDFAQFLRDMGPRPSPLYSIERLDNDGPYAPENCVWATRSQQNNNQRQTVRIVVDGQQISLRQTCAQRGLNPQVVYRRLRQGWTPEDALARPVRITARNAQYYEPGSGRWLEGIS